MKRKYISFIAILLVMALMLSACGSNNPTPQNSSESDTSAQTQESTQPSSDSSQETTEPSTQEEKADKEVKTVELTLENWQDYLEISFDYLIERDDWDENEIKYFIQLVTLKPKDNIQVVNIEEGRAVLDITATECSIINYNIATGEYTFISMSEDEHEKYDEFFMVNYKEIDDILSTHTILTYDISKSPETDALWALVAGYRPDRYYTIEEGTLVGPATSNYDVEVIKIKGTLQYIEN